MWYICNSLSRNKKKCRFSFLNTDIGLPPSNVMFVKDIDRTMHQLVVSRPSSIYFYKTIT